MRKQILVSDMDGTEIPEGTGAVVTIRPFDNRKTAKELHVTDEQAENMKGRPVARRGRKSSTTGSGRRREPATA